MQKEIYDQMKQRVAAVKKSLGNKSIGLLIGTRSVENRYCTENAPISEKGYLAIAKVFEESNLSYSIIDIDDQSLLEELAKVDIVFIYMQGEFGEDGKIQGFLEYINKPYTGCSALPNAFGYDKFIFKRIAASYTVPVPDDIFCLTSAIEYSEEPIRNMHSKYGDIIIKPRFGGSSVDLKFSDSISTTTNFLSAPDRLYSAYLLEEYIDGRSITVGTFRFNGETLILPSLEIKTENKIYDADSKHGKSNYNYNYPRDIPKRVEEQIISDLLQLDAAIGFDGLCRYDFLLTEDKYYLLEVNTIPGINPHSNIVKEFEMCGIGFSDVVFLYLGTMDEQLRL